MDELDYPVAAPADVDPAIYRAQIIQTMATRYMNHMRDVQPPFTMEEAMDAAKATWDTDWDDDPKPRTIEAGIEAADSDLAYWVEE
ncbi:hypothetical protein [Sphingobium sp.]|uniref:hypothetical protein n=1 Tax=Sphingobium sp. TaxID=1912891 RepID=UPI000DB67326|nr:hypothetical protein [Sphingobium sp.]PZU65264.1 MAG: hypothetical protein DI540_18025 [Sphingobium sp.]